MIITLGRNKINGNTAVVIENINGKVYMTERKTHSSRSVGVM